MNRLILSSVIAAFSALSIGSATQVGSTLNIVTGNGQEDFTVEIGPLPGLVRIFTAPGIPDGATFFGINHLVVRTNAGFDKVNVKLESTAVPTMDINTGTGPSEVIVDLKVLPTATASSMGRIVGNGADDKVVIRTESQAGSFMSRWQADLGAGNNQGASIVTSQEATQTISTNLIVTGAAGVDMWESIVDAKSQHLQVGLDARLGAGDDMVLSRGVGIGGNASANLTAILDLGLGNDRIDLDVSGVATTTMSGRWTSGAGDDLVFGKFSGSLRGAPVFSTGDGADFLSIIADRVDGSPRLLMGTGNDRTEFLAAPQFTGSPFSDGGPGFDTFKGIGTRVNYEVIE